MKNKFFIVTTIPDSFIFFKGQIQVLKKYFNVEVVSSSGELFDRFCTDEDVYGHRVEMKRDISLFKDLQSLLNMTLLFIKYKPFYVHGSTPKAGLISMMAGYICRVPVRIYYIHGLRYQGKIGIKRKLLIIMEKIACLLATDIFCVSKGVQKELLRNKITKKKINLIHYGSVNGINLDYFRYIDKDLYYLDKRFHFIKDDFVFGFVGRVVADKGINELVLAFQRLHEKHNNTKLLLVGPFENKLDPLESSVKKIIKSNKNIIEVGPQKDVRFFYSLMNVFVFPSYREGFGVSLAEALACELPVIATDVIGCNEVIDHPSIGSLVESKSIESLYLAMMDSIKNYNELLKFSKLRRDSVKKKYDQNIVWEKTLKAYKNLH